MSFLQPFLLFGLPLIALPLIIHLINQRRHQSVSWGAMMFLREATKMSRGYVRLRYWLIMAMRMLAIATLIFAVSRPMTGGFLGLAGSGRPDTAIVILDRSPSMEQATDSGFSKRELGLQRLVSALETLDPKRTVLLDSVSQEAVELQSYRDLIGFPRTGPSSQSADIAGLLQKAQDYLLKQEPGPCDIWICSDLRESDWQSRDGRWAALREGFLQYPGGVRFRLLGQSQSSEANLAARVTQATRIQSGDMVELSLDLEIKSTQANATSLPSRTVSLGIEVNGAPSSVDVTMNGGLATLSDFRVALDPQSPAEGWGVVRLPKDENDADNQAYFVYTEPMARKTAVVSEDSEVARPLSLVASISADTTVASEALSFTPDQTGLIPWPEISLLLWHGPFPEPKAAASIQDFLEQGGRAIFFPDFDSGMGDLTFLGQVFSSIEDNPGLDVKVQSWRGESDVLAHARSGDSLPLGELKIYRYARLEHDSQSTDESEEGISLARLSDGNPLLNRVPFGRGAAYFLATTPSLNDSTLARDGVALYAMIQRALAFGAQSKRDASNLIAGTIERPTQDWRPLDVLEGASDEFTGTAGVYETNRGTLAVNRAVEEDTPMTVPSEQTEGLFEGLNFSLIEGDDQDGPLLREIWRMFLIFMMVALLVEALLCFPKKPATESLGDGGMGRSVSAGKVGA